MTNTQEAQAKLTYEQLESAANQLAQQNQALKQQINEMNYFNLLQRLDYLFKVVENDEKFATDFVDSCKTEIVNLLSIDENTANTPTNTSTNTKTE